MYKIELSIPAVMSLHINSSSASDIVEEDEAIDEGEEIEELAMSDEEFEKLSEEDFLEKKDDVTDTDVGDIKDDTLGDEKDEETATEEVNEEEPTPNAEEGGSEQTEEVEVPEDDQPNENTEQQKLDDDKAYQDAFNLLYGKPIKASGREVQLRNPEHAKNFIEMGIDYNKKMHSMKPHLRTLKTLEKEGLLDENKQDRLNLLLEVEKGNKDALKRLISESGMDPLDLADEDVIEQSKNYQPQNHIISEEEVEIEEALNAIEGTEGQQRTLDVMTKQMDAQSRQIISKNPRYIVALNDDIQSGAYDKIMETVQYQRDMKQVPTGMSDMELYIETAKRLSAPEAQNQQAPVSVQQEQTKPNTPQSSETRRRKVGMSGSRSSSKQKKQEYNPMEVLGMDDDKFMKEMGMDLL